ncbi:MAG: methyltransferase [Marmoricola sp.]|nr:methyltransferase [Marmoricola sp.]
MSVIPQPTSAENIAFGDLVIAYDDRVLSPRPWTELQSRWGAELARTAPAGDILELCAGAGQIGLLALSLHGPGRRLVAVDVSEDACRFTEQNAVAAGLADLVEIRNQGLESACAPGEVFPVILADPPWVPSAQTQRFPEDPLTAIDGGHDGLDLARACLEVIVHHLHVDGSALIQVGTDEQVDLLREEFGAVLAIREVRGVLGRGVIALVTKDV